MNALKNPWIMLAIGIVVGGTLLKNRVSTLPVLNKIPSL
jgi:hypothetical protein